MKPPAGRGDLARLIAGLGEERAGRAARWLGFCPPTPRSSEQGEPAPLARSADKAASEVADQPAQAPDEPDYPSPVPFLRLETIEDLTSQPKPKVEAAEPWKGTGREPEPLPNRDPLARWSRLWPQLFTAAAESREGAALDVPAVVGAWSRGEVPPRVPRLERPKWPNELLVLVDESAHLWPIWDDQLDVLQRLEATCGSAGIEMNRLDGGLSALDLDVWRRRALSGRRSALALSDLGMHPASRAGDRWSELGTRLTESGWRLTALVPMPPDRCVPATMALWNGICWEQTSGCIDRGDDTEVEAARRRRALKLLALLSAALRVEPGLLRDVRRSAGIEADVGTELDVWAHESVDGASAEAFRFKDDAPLGAWRASLEQRANNEGSREALQQAVEHLARWHGPKPEVWLAEVLILKGLGLERYVKENEQRLALEFGRRLGATLRRGAASTPALFALRWWFREVGRRLPRGTWAHEALRQSLHESEAATKESFAEMRHPEGTDPALLASFTQGDGEVERPVELYQHGEQLRFVPRGQAVERGAVPIGALAVGRRVLAASEAWLEPRSADVDAAEVLSVVPGELIDLAPSYRCPSWAREVGLDAFGWWAEVDVGGAAFRMRYIHPGTFRMGSPDGYEMAFGDERPQHVVTLTQGFWIAETPCTQAVWQTVTGEQPSHFEGRDRPVETVSFDDVSSVIAAINRRLPTLGAALPTEAQWEYACRAGTDGPRYGEPVDAIAWYAENSGRETKPVAGKKPNACGLFDMLGNVFEWCHDGQREFHDGAVTDPVGRTGMGALRVIRGGAWNDNAWNVRAAYRNALPPANCSNDVGFRVARGLQNEEPAPPEVARDRSGKQAERSGAAAGHASNSWAGPPWAEEWGTDEFGVWARVRIREASLRMRWIPAGTFLMGSPEDEPGRYSDEGPRHPVELTAGYWLAEHAATQALWTAVTGDNPSRFQTPTRPVEQVSFKDVTRFLDAVNTGETGLKLRLPTEAEWERACRAGTDTATYAGAIEIRGDRDAPVLDEIAWYGGNSGVDFELDNGADSSGWGEKQYDHATAGSHPVGLKRPNGLGLYDMLGDVLEWCSDGMRDYDSGLATDPVGPANMGAARVIRGGAWYNGSARDVRAAYRGASPPAGRDDGVGFRLARGRTGPEDEPPAEVLARAGEQAERSGVATGPGLWLWTERTKARIGVFEKPDWATAVGRDRYGLWATIRVVDVPYRLRWIPPGRFLMGSPTDEQGRVSDEEAASVEYWHAEGPRHEVLLSHGYWLGEHPVTQAVWRAILGGNPSRFQSDDRPVESVSFEDVAEFLAKANHGGAALRLPTEAEWERACRAETETATYARPLRIRGARSAPILDNIAWYGGNTGVQYDLEEGQDSSDWLDKQYDHVRAGTRAVGMKRPNGFGLYDMLGNVFEWCGDGPRVYSSAPATDPSGPTDVGTPRVIRGGAWYNIARYVRAASRYAYPPANRNFGVGFRLARGR